MNRDVFEHFNPIDLPCDRCGKVTRPDDVHTCTPKALVLANSAHLGYRVGWQREAATELRRLHDVNAELRRALCALVLNIDAGGATLGAMYDARVVIAKAEAV